MTSVELNKELTALNTFHLAARAARFVSVTDPDDLPSVLDQVGKDPLHILGGGSNILLTGDVEGWVLKMDIPGIEQLREEPAHVYVRAGAGVNWHQLVLFTIGRDWGGLENLSLIPGNVGASPIQNIGAYGVELKDVFYELEAWDTAERKRVTLALNDCHFGYRDSIFKTSARGRYIILYVTFLLNKTPSLHTGYGAIGAELKAMGILKPGIREVSDAVIRIRRSKLPDPAEIGNAGSFFKNPVVPAALADNLKSHYPDLPEWAQPNDEVKLSAAWLIEKAGWKSIRRGVIGVHEKQSLVLVNYGGGLGQDLLVLSAEIIASVKHQFGVSLEREVNVW